MLLSTTDSAFPFVHVSPDEIAVTFGLEVALRVKALEAAMLDTYVTGELLLGRCYSFVTYWATTAVSNTKVPRYDP